MNDKPKIIILLLEDIRQKRLDFVELLLLRLSGKNAW